MKSFKSLALVFAAAVITLGASAQASTTAKPMAKSDAKKTTAASKAPASKAVVKSDAKSSTAKKSATTAPATK